MLLVRTYVFKSMSDLGGPRLLLHACAAAHDGVCDAERETACTYVDDTHAIRQQAAPRLLPWYDIL